MTESSKPRGKLILFASKDLPQQMAAAETWAEAARAAGYEARVVDKLTADPEDLMLVATYNVVEPLVVVALDGKLQGRWTDLPNLAEIPHLLSVAEVLVAETCAS